MRRRLQSRRLALWMNGERMGAWERSSGAEELHYDTAWVASPRGRALSLSLPFTPGNRPHKGAAVRAWFDNLLPDSRPIRERLALDGSSHREEDRATFFRAQVLFWMLCAPDGHAKNFSLALHAGGAYRLTLYDVMSAYPLLGEGPGRLSPHRVRLAMAVRATNAHWEMKDVRRRHWVALGQRHGVVAPGGQGAEALANELVQRTPAVVRRVHAQLPPGFPGRVADAVRAGLEQASRRLAD